MQNMSALGTMRRRAIMIDTHSLKDQDICLVSLESDDGGLHRNILCIFIGGAFQNIEETHTYEVYGSSVYKFKKIQTSRALAAILSDKTKVK